MAVAATEAAPPAGAAGLHAGVLVGGLRRGHLQLRRSHLLRVHRRHGAQQARGRHGGHLRRWRLLRSGLRRRCLQLRRRHLLRQHGLHPPQPADRRHGGRAGRRRVLAGGGGRGHLQLRVGHVLRQHRQHPAQQAGRRHGGHAERARLLAGRFRRRHLQLRRRLLLRQHGVDPPQQADRQHDHGAGRRRLLPRCLGRGHLQLRHGTLLRLARRAEPQASDRGGGGHADRQWLLVHGHRGAGVEFRARPTTTVPLRRTSSGPSWPWRRHPGTAPSWARRTPRGPTATTSASTNVGRFPGAAPDRYRAGRREFVGEHQPVPRHGVVVGGRRTQPLHLPDVRHVGVNEPGCNGDTSCNAGYQAGIYAYNDAAAANAGSTSIPWWLDVETASANWSGNLAENAAVRPGRTQRAARERGDSVRRDLRQPRRLERHCGQLPARRAVLDGRLSQHPQRTG